MSYDIFMQGFSRGDAADGDGHAAMSILSPLINERQGSWARITFSDGEADVYGIDEPASGLMFNHISGESVWQVMFDVAAAAGFTIMPIDCPACVPPGVSSDDLPTPFCDEAVVVTSGDALRAIVLS